MILEEGTLQFDFSDALTGFKFDEQDKASPNFHGLSHCMKAVDFVVELDDCYLFIEIKDYRDSSRFSDNGEFNDLVKILFTKFRDSFIYRWAEEKTDKPIKYLCLIELENPLISRLMTELKRMLPQTTPNARWRKPVAVACIIANVDSWNASFPDWQISRI